MARLLLTAGLVALALPAVPAQAAIPLPSQDAFYTYTGATPLAQVKPGTVLKTRPVTLGADVNPTPLPATQLLYRTQDELGRPTATVTTVITPPGSTVAPKIIAYLSFYDSLADKCDPSYTLQGGDPGAANTQLTDAEQAFVEAYVATGNVITVPDFEGPGLHWTAGHEAGRSALDAVRATESFLKAPATTMVGLTGYSGGSIAAEWAAELAPVYAPEVNLVGVAAGGVPVHFAHNLTYINGSPVWSGIIPAVFHALAQGYDLDLDTYLSPYGKSLVDKDKHGCIGDFSGTHPGLTAAQMMKPRYRDILHVKAFADIVNNLIMGTAPGAPKVPMLLAVGNNGSSIGDDVMVTGDVEALAHEYCGQNVPILFETYPQSAHTQAGGIFEPNAVSFLVARFAGVPMVDNCATVGEGNSLAPLKPTAATPPTSSTPPSKGTSPGQASGPSLPATGPTGLVGLAALVVLAVAAATRRARRRC